MRNIIIVALATLAIWPATALAAKSNQPTIDWLYRACKIEIKNAVGNDVSEVGLCTGCISGYLDGHNFKNKRRIFCVPDGVTNGQATEVFKSWAARNPKMWHEHAVLGTALAFLEAWPCTKAKGAKR